MKKILVPLLATAAGLTSFNSHAQSSVTLFGILDVAVQSLKADGVGSSTRLASGSNQPSRLGFRGQEDLGGGLKASFWIEGTIAADSGIGGSNVSGW